MKIGVDIGGAYVRMGIVDGGVILKKIVEPCRSDRSEKEIVNHLKEMLHKIMNSNIGGIGVGVPSVVDVEKGIVYNAFNIPSWKEVHLKKALEEEFQVPIYINNDCNCFAFGERYYGEGTSYRNIVCVALGTGLGAGVIVDDRLYGGRNNGAGEIGSLPYLDHDYEYYCTNHFFLKEYNITGGELYQRALQGEVEALNIWKKFGTNIGNLIKAIIFTYDPEAIILGGGISTSAKFFSKKMHETINSCPFPHPETKKRIKILFSKREDVTLLGASGLVTL